MDAIHIPYLQRMYSLSSRVIAFELRQTLTTYIKATRKIIVLDEIKDKDMVSSLLDLKSIPDTIWEEFFLKNEAFSNTIKDSFECLINLRKVSYLNVVHVFFCVYTPT